MQFDLKDASDARVCNRKSSVGIDEEAEGRRLAMKYVSHPGRSRSPSTRFNSSRYSSSCCTLAKLFMTDK
jgi:hypothetical protein